MNCVVGGITNAPLSSTSQASSASESGFTATGIAPTRSKPTAHRWTSVSSIRTCGVSQVQGPRSLEVLEAVTDGPMPEHFNYFNMAEVLICWVTTSFPVVADCATTMAIALPASFELCGRPRSGAAGLGGFQPRRAKLDRPRTARGDGGLAAGDLWGYYFLQGEQTRGRAGPFAVVRGTTNRGGCVRRTATTTTRITATTTSDFVLPGTINFLPYLLYPADVKH